jgi:low affinity Fe/Cu permease
MPNGIILLLYFERFVIAGLRVKSIFLKTNKNRNMKSNKKGLNRFFNKFSQAVTKGTGSPLAFIIAIIVILVWGVTGPLFGFSNTWQLVINTGTTVITFLMVFVIQQSQNRETTAIQLKLNELLAANRNASNRLVDIEDLTEDELAVLKKFYVKLSLLAQNETDLFSSHSIDEARHIHSSKLKSIKEEKLKPVNEEKRTQE